MRLPLFRGASGRPSSVCITDCVGFRLAALLTVAGLTGCAGLQAPGSGTPDASGSKVAEAVAPATAPSVPRPAVAPGSTAASQPEGSETAPEVEVDLPGRRFASVWDRIRAGFAMPELPTRLVEEKERFYLERRDYLNRMMTRGGRYLYYIVEEIEKRGMPTELALLPFVESAMNPTAMSVAQASGLWQFIPSTGRAYNLEQDWWVDNRRDVVKSTQAALDYLQKIYEMNGRDWFLALASYNWGEGAVARAVKSNQARGRPTDYLSLNMPNETRHYVPKLIALKNILARAEQLGLTLPDLPNRPYFVTIEKTRPIDLKLAAQFAGMTLAEFLELNPAHNRPVIQASRNNQIKLPADRVDAFLEAVERHSESNRTFATWQPYTLKQGDTLESVAQRSGVSPTELRRANGLKPNSRILAGTRLLVPHQSVDNDRQVENFVAPRIYEQVDLAPVHHTVGPKDTLNSIATRYKIPVAQLRTQNKIASGEPARGTRLLIRPGGTQTLLITERGEREIMPVRQDPAAPASPKPAVATARAQPAVLKAGDCHDAQECRLLAALNAAGSPATAKSSAQVAPAKPAVQPQTTPRANAQPANAQPANAQPASTPTSKATTTAAAPAASPAQTKAAAPVGSSGGSAAKNTPAAPSAGNSQTKASTTPAPPAKATTRPENTPPTGAAAANSQGAKPAAKPTPSTEGGTVRTSAPASKPASEPGDKPAPTVATRPQT